MRRRGISLRLALGWRTLNAVCGAGYDVSSVLAINLGGRETPRRLTCCGSLSPCAGAGRHNGQGRAIRAVIADGGFVDEASRLRPDCTGAELSDLLSGMLPAADFHTAVEATSNVVQHTRPKGSAARSGSFARLPIGIRLGLLRAPLTSGQSCLL